MEITSITTEISEENTIKIECVGRYYPDIEKFVIHCENSKNGLREPNCPEFLKFNEKDSDFYSCMCQFQVEE